MTQLAPSSTPWNQYSEGRYATTTARFADSGEFAATAWQGESTRSVNRPCRRQVSPRRLASPTASTVSFNFMLPEDVSGSEPNPAASTSVKSLEQLAPSVDASASMSEELVYGVYAPPRPRRVLHSQVVEFRTETLRRRKPRITGDDSFLAVIDDD
jgi:hypothetical protein